MAAFKSQVTNQQSQIRRRRLVFLLTLVVLTRILFAFLVWHSKGPVGFSRADTPQYIGPAQSLMHGSFSSSGYFAPASAPELYRTPGYPLLLVPALALHHLVLIGILENLVLAAISAWLVWRIAELLFPGSSAQEWAVLLYCFEPLGLLYANTLMSDTAFTAALLLFVWLFLRALQKPARGPIALAALILGGATYVRPVTLYFGICLSLLLLLSPQTFSWKQRIVRAVLFPCVFLLTLVPWVARNLELADYRGFSTAQEWNLYFTTNSALRATLGRQSVAAAVEYASTMTPEQYLQLHPEQRGWSEGQKARFWAAEARRTILSHPLVFFRVYAKNCAAIVASPAVTEVLREVGLFPTDRTELPAQMDRGFLAAASWLLRRYPVAAVLLPLMLLQLLLYYIFALAGLRRLPLQARILFAGTYVYFVLVSGFLTAGARFRMPVMPLICISAAIAISNRNSHLLQVDRKCHRLPS
jgi:4-amino-4-deoxy-L-arabinose transferase-like glycosyltransferase